MNRFVSTLKIVCLLLLLLLVVLLFVNVIMRYVVRSPIDWVEEAGQLILIWLTFLGAAAAAAEKRHMGMDMLMTYLKGKRKKVLEGAISTLVILCLGIVTYYGIDMTIYNLEQKSESLRFSYAVFYVAIPIGCLCYIVFELTHFLRLFKRDSIEGGGSK
jgi:TRAP-type C4-dicarboxylate transport system permease small subunit